MAKQNIGLKIRIKNFKLQEFKASSDEQGIVEAYVSIFGNVDSYGEIVEKGAFAESLKLKLPKVVWSHNWDMPIGVVLEAREDEKGLYVKFQLIKGVQKADEALALMQAKGGDGRPAIDEFSIGYSVDEEEIGTDGVVHLKKLRLYEISPVLVGANSATELLTVKGIRGVDEVEIKVGDEETQKKDIEPEKQEKKEDPAKPAVEEEKETPAVEEKKFEARVLDADNLKTISDFVSDVDRLTDDLDNFRTTLKALVKPLKGLLNANENAGIKVAPPIQSDKVGVRVVASLKRMEKDLGFALRVIKS